MKKNILIGLFILALALMLTLSCGAAGNVTDQVIVIGQNGVNDLNSAMNALSKNAGNAVIYLTGSTYINSQVEIPSNISGLKSVTFASYTGSPVTVSMGGSVICANGVPVTVGQGVSLSNGFLVGGKCSAGSGSVSTDSSALIIDGSAYFVIGGGLAMNYGSVSTVKNANILINGSANVVHGGGYAFNGGVADVSGFTNILVTRNGSISDAIYGGGYASGNGANAPVAAAQVTVLGTAKKIVKNAGLSENGGSAAIGSYDIQLLNPIDSGGGSGNPYPYSYATPQPTAAPTVNSTLIFVGKGQQARNFTEAVNLIPNNAGNVEFRLVGDLSQDEDVELPRSRGIVSLTINGNNNQRSIVYWPEDIGFFANGIPLTITSSVYFSDGIVYGGANVGANQQSSLQSTYLDISGTVNKVVAGSKAKGTGANARVGSTTLIFRGRAKNWLYGGSAALYGGYATVDGTASITMTEGARVENSIAAGGYAFGSGSQSIVANSNLDLSGSITYAVYLGGYADQSGSSVTNGQSYLILQPKGYVANSVWYGGRAFNNGSVYLDTAAAQINGAVGAYLHKEGGRAETGGTVTTRVVR